jgi:hypothetical protein
VALHFLGKDPDSPNGKCPAVWYDDADGSAIVQGWVVEDPGVVTELLETSGRSSIPADETILRIPGRLVPLFKEFPHDDASPVDQ